MGVSPILSGVLSCRYQEIPMGNDVCIRSTNPEYCEDLASQRLQPSDGEGATIDLRDGTQNLHLHLNPDSDLDLNNDYFRI